MNESELTPGCPLDADVRLEKALNRGSGDVGELTFGETTALLSRASDSGRYRSCWFGPFLSGTEEDNTDDANWLQLAKL